MTQTTPYSILIIDDETSNLKVLSSLLKEDYRVIAVKSGSQGLVKAQTLVPDLILLDVMMPDMDGFEVIKTLKKQPMTADIPVIFITGLNSSKDEEMGLTLGAIDYIYKPFFPAVVRARISSQIKILEQKRELEALSEALKKEADAKVIFLANMSHEIRTPLSTIIGYTESYLQGDVLQSDHKEVMGAIGRSGKHLLNLINDILDFSKIDADQLEIEVVDVDLIELLHQAYQIAIELAKNKAITIRFDIKQSIPRYIKTDPTRLSQILLNLLSNAIKFTEVGEVSLSIHAAGDSLLSFAVTDTGIGIHTDKISQLFAAFNQLDPSTTRKYGGTGLGLSISQSLCKALGGEIKVSSEAGKGSIFDAQIKLDPLKDTAWLSQYDFSTFTTNSKSTAQSEQHSVEGKVLLAEDHDENRKLFTLILQSLGLEVDSVANGQEAVEQVLVTDYDLILMDIQMPVMDGINALKTIRYTGSDTPVIALTANVMAQDIEDYLAVGFVDHCAKPLDRAELTHKIKQHINVAKEEKTLDPAKFKELQQSFVNKLNDYAQQLERAVQQNDIEQLRYLSHLLKGSAATFGFSTISANASQLEKELINNPSGQAVQTETTKLLNELSVQIG